MARSRKLVRKPPFAVAAMICTGKRQSGRDNFIVSFAPSEDALLCFRVEVAFNEEQFNEFKVDSKYLLDFSGPYVMP